MDIDRINKVISYVSSVQKTDEVVPVETGNVSLINAVEKTDNKDVSTTAVKEDYGAERYLICNPNMLYRYVSRGFISKSTFKINKAAYAEAAKKYGYKKSTKRNCFEESYI